MRFIFVFLFLIFGFSTCIAQRSNHSIVKAVIDSVSINEIKYFSNRFPSIFEYYQYEQEDEMQVWSEKMFGSAQGVDMTYAQVLYFKISTNYQNTNYPISNLYDRAYRSAYVFKEHQNITIDLTIDKDHNLFSEYDSPKLHPDKVLKKTDTLMFPLRLSMVNGYAKSKSLFYRNGRVKKIEVLINDQTVGFVELQDTPLIQQFSIHTLLKRTIK